MPRGTLSGALIALTVVAAAFLPTAATAHPGGIAKDGCHNHRASNTCHCHRVGASRPGCTGGSGDGQDSSGGADLGTGGTPAAAHPPPGGTPPAPAEWIRIATWNLNRLHWRTGGALWRGAVARNDEDYETLARYARGLNADVVAFQEVNGPRAAARVFPARDYALYFSGRYDSRYDDIYNGFAVRKGRFERVERRDYEALGLGSEARYQLRWGVDLTVRRDGQSLRLLNVHLKSKCFAKRLENPPRPALPQARPAGRAPRIMDRRPLARRRALCRAGRFQPRGGPARTARPPVEGHRRRRPAGPEAPPAAGRPGTGLLARDLALPSSPDRLLRIRRACMATGGRGVVPAGRVDRQGCGRPPGPPLRSLSDRGRSLLRVRCHEIQC